MKPPKTEEEFETYEKRLVESIPSATRNILLIRHGRYEDTKEKWLSELGETVNLLSFLSIWGAFSHNGRFRIS